MAATLDSGRHDHLGDLFVAHWPAVYRYLRARTTADQAEELTSAVFEAAAQRLSISGETVSPQWLITVAKRRLIDHWRRAARTAEKHRLFEGHARASVRIGNGCFDEVDDAQFVCGLLQDISPVQQRALTYRYILDMTIGDVADQLGVSYKAAESLLARARQKLRVVV